MRDIQIDRQEHKYRSNPCSLLCMVASATANALTVAAASRSWYGRYSKQDGLYGSRFMQCKWSRMLQLTI